MNRPEIRFAGPVLGSDAPLELAEFYHRLLGWPYAGKEVASVDGAIQEWAILRAPSGDHKIEFQYEPLFTSPTWPPEPGQQHMAQHLDFGVADLDAGVRWALNTGAHLEDHQPQRGVRVLRDPSGHIFCLFRDDRM